MGIHHTTHALHLRYLHLTHQSHPSRSPSPARHITTTDLTSSSSALEPRVHSTSSRGTSYPSRRPDHVGTPRTASTGTTISKIIRPVSGLDIRFAKTDLHKADYSHIYAQIYPQDGQARQTIASPKQTQYLVGSEARPGPGYTGTGR